MGAPAPPAVAPPTGGPAAGAPATSVLPEFDEERPPCIQLPSAKIIF